MGLFGHPIHKTQISLTHRLTHQIMFYRNFSQTTECMPDSFRRPRLNASKMFLYLAVTEHKGRLFIPSRSKVCCYLIKTS